jgi:hypothetical protein
MNKSVNISLEKDLETLSMELSNELNKPVEVLDILRIPRNVPKSIASDSIASEEYLQIEFQRKYNTQQFQLQFINDKYNSIGLVYRD